MARPDPFGPVIALDIDGTSGDYHSHFTRFAAQWTGRPMPNPAQYTGGVPFHKHLGLSRETYLKIKLAYRQGGLKRSMPPYFQIGEFTKAVRRKGVGVWICTTRPYLSLDNIEPDTRHWLKQRAKMQYDGLLFGEHKYRDLVKQVGVERVVCVYDDLPAMIRQAVGLGLPAALRTQPYNAEWALPDSSANTWRVDSVDAMWFAFKEALSDWKEQHHG